MKRSLVFLTLVALCAGCAPALKDLKPALATADSGNLSFAAAGSQYGLILKALLDQLTKK